MIIKIKKPTIIQSAGNKPKIIEEFIGCVNSQTNELSIARMQSPAGWKEPGQKSEFNEYTVVLKGLLRVRTDDKTIDIHAGEAVIAPAGKWSNIVPLPLKVPNISLYVCLLFYQRLFIVINNHNLLKIKP